MSPPYVIQVELPPEAQKLKKGLEIFPQRIMAALQRGLDKATPHIAARVQEYRLTGQGPFPVADHRLGVRSSQLIKSVRFTNAVIQGNTVTASIGSPVRYAAVHEFGYEGIVTVRPFFRKNRQRDQFSTVERVSKRSGRRYRSMVKTASGIGQVKGHERRMRIPARAPFGYGVADSDVLITNAVTSELETEFKSL